MKKISYLMALPVLLGACFTSCKEDTQPRLEVPTEFVLNTPAMADQTYIFRADESYQNLNDITFTVSQPNYGLGCVPTYTVQLAKSEAGFAAWDEAETTGNVETDNAILGDDGLPLAYTLPAFTSTSAVLNIDGTSFCEAVNTLYGFDMDNYNNEVVQVSVRVHAAIDNAPQSRIWSNAVNISVSSYIPVKDPGKLYLIGQPTGWDINADKVYLEETGIGTKIYFGNVFIPANEPGVDGKGDLINFQFRFYSQLGDWESFAVGSQNEDNPVDITFDSEGVFNGSVFMSVEKGDKLGKGSWQDKTWTGGNLEITVNLKDMTIKMQKAEGKKIYAIGNFQGWDINKDNCALAETAPNSNIYEGTFDVTDPAGGIEFAIYTELGNWDTNFVGPKEGEEKFSVASGPYKASVVARKANFKSEQWTAPKVKVNVDLNSYTITIEGAE